MNRRTIVSFVRAAIVLVLSAPAGFAQQSAQLPKLNPFRTPTKDAATPAGASLKAALESGRAKAAVNANAASNNGQLQTFTYTVTSSRDGYFVLYRRSALAAEMLASPAAIQHDGDA